MKKPLITLLALTAIFALTSVAWATQPDVAGIKEVLSKLEEAHRTQNKAAAQAAWHPEGWSTNLVGGSGLRGEAAFKQGSREGWYLKPNMDELTNIGRSGKAWFMPCDIWSIKKKQAMDQVVAVVAFHKDKWVVLGAGESRKEVEALAKRWDEGKALKPPETK